MRGTAVAETKPGSFPKPSRYWLGFFCRIPCAGSDAIWMSLFQVLWSYTDQLGNQNSTLTAGTRCLDTLSLAWGDKDRREYFTFKTYNRGFQKLSYVEVHKRAWRPFPCGHRPGSLGEAGGSRGGWHIISFSTTYLPEEQLQPST